MYGFLLGLAGLALFIFILSTLHDAIFNAVSAGYTLTGLERWRPHPIRWFRALPSSTEKFTFFVACFTGLSAVVTGGLVYVAFLQLRETQSDQRPIIYLASPVTKVIDRINEPACCIWQIPSAQNKERIVSISFLLGNSGNSQTQRLKIFTQCTRVGSTVTQSSEPFSLFKWNETRSMPEVIGPKQIKEIAGIAGCELTGEDVLNFQMGVIHEYLLGEIRYGDRTGTSR